jgi:CGNR zinc finger protein
MSQIKIPSTPVSVLKRNTGNFTWVMQLTKNGTDALLERDQRLDVSNPPTFDGREYLSAFMAVRELEDALVFVNRFGSPAAEILKWGEISFSEFIALQKLVRTAALTPLSEWPPKELSIGLNPERLALRWDTTPFTFVHETDMGIEACCAQVFFEKLSGVEFRWCARPDCDEMFRKETGHDKIYCSPECAHLMAVRANRARANKTRVRKKGSRKRR